ncbi:MAG: GNAT family N-acetyltransferase [bacterium]|nr:GNAT family N-acetyltransferase [bacterium]
MKNEFIVGEKVYLRPVELDDLELFCRCANHPDARYSFFIAFPSNRVRQEEFIRSLYKEKELIFFTIVIKESDIPIGHTAFHRIDWVSRVATYGIIIGDSRYWGKGYGSEVTQLMVKYGFETLGLNRIQLHVWKDNIAGIKAYERAGFKQEGLLRQAMFHEGHFCDFYIMSILREEYFKK